MLIYVLVNSAFSCFASLEIPLFIKVFWEDKQKVQTRSLHFFVYQNLLLKLEILLGVVVGDILHHLPQEVKLAGRQQTRLHIISNKVAERSAEILVARIAQETA